MQKLLLLIDKSEVDFSELTGYKFGIGFLL